MKKPNYSNVNYSRAYVRSVPMRPGELTIMTSKSAVASMVHGCAVGEESVRAGMGTFILNLGMSQKRFAEYFHANHEWKNDGAQFLFKTCVRGNLNTERENISQVVSEAKISTLIILGWEWASSSWRQKQRLLGFLRELMDASEVSVVVYSHCFNAPRPGRLDKGGVGKLALMAMFVAELEATDELEESCPKPPPLVYRSLAEKQAIERGAHALINKINEIQDGSPKITTERDERIAAVVQEEEEVMAPDVPR